MDKNINNSTKTHYILVSIGVLVLRKKHPQGKGYRVPMAPVLPLLSAVLCVYLMMNLTTLTWARFLVWMALGTTIYCFYGMRHSRLAKGH